MSATDNPRESPTPVAPTQFKNAARASVLSGRYRAKPYTSPLDMKNLITPEEFHRQFIKNGSRNPYTKSTTAAAAAARASGMSEVPAAKVRGSLESPVTPVTASSAATARRSGTDTSFGGDTFIEHGEEDHSPLWGWYDAFWFMLESGLRDWADG